jgi:hypothetical protein
VHALARNRSAQRLPDRQASERVRRAVNTLTQSIMPYLPVARRVERLHGPRSIVAALQAAARHRASSGRSSHAHRAVVHTPYACGPQRGSELQKASSKLLLKLLRRRQRRGTWVAAPSCAQRLHPAVDCAHLHSSSPAARNAESQARARLKKKERKIAPGGIRTHNPSVKYRVLYFLSYRATARLTSVLVLSRNAILLTDSRVLLRASEGGVRTCTVGRMSTVQKNREAQDTRLL